MSDSKAPLPSPAMESHHTEASETGSQAPAIDASSKDRDPEANTLASNEKDKEDEEDTYLHGMKLALVFIALAFSVFLIILDQTILIPAIPVIASHFNAVDQIGWISSSYFVTQCSTILLWGQALAFFEQKVPLLMAICIFELGSLIAAVSPNFVTLIVGRAVAGLGGAAIMVATISISSRIIELKRRPIFFGLFGIMFVLGSSLGPILGGSFTSHVTWRWCFYASQNINLPVGGLSILAISLLIPRLEPPATAAKPPTFLLKVLRRSIGERSWLADNKFVPRLTTLDWIGGLISLGGIVSLTLALTTGGAQGWSNTTVIVGLTMAGVALILLILWEALVMREDGMIPLRVARFASVWGAAGVASMRMITSLAIMTYLPTFLQATRHESAFKSAISTLPYAGCMAVCALLGSVVVQKSGRYKWALVSGSAVSAIGAGLMYTLHADSTYARIAGFQVIASLGAGLVQMNAVLAAQADVDSQGMKADIPQATALVSFFQLIGGSLGGSLGGAVLTTGLRNYASSLPADTLNALLRSVEEVWVLTGTQQDLAIYAYTRAMNNVFLTGAVASVLGFLLALICRDHNIKGKNYKE